YFGKVRNSGVKGPPLILTEDLDMNPQPGVKNGGGERPVIRPGGRIVISSAGGDKGGGREVPAELLGGRPRQLDDAAPFRPARGAGVTAKENPSSPRAFVNRTWSQLFGRGLVTPVDNMHDGNPPSHPALLELLAAEFVASGFDVKHLVRCICNSQAYQRTSRSAAGNEADAVLFSGMAGKRIGPERPD